MPTSATLQHPQHAVAGGPITVMNTNQPIPLRRAVYVHVSDLTSAYNIDHARLEEELQRAKSADVSPDVEASQTAARMSVPAELDTSSQKRLQPPRGGYNLCVLVGSVRIVVDKNRVDGSRVRLAEVEVGDETGTVSLRARDEQIDVLTEVSERSGAVVLRNCTLELYQGKHLRLAVTKWGKLSVYPDKVASTPPPPSKINRDRNFSKIDLSVVASEMEGGESYQAADAVDIRQSQNRIPVHQPVQMVNAGRRPRRGAKPVVGAPMPVTYGDSSLAMRYPGGLHGYGNYPEGMLYSYGPNQQDSIPTQQQQQMMMQQQYGMQHQLQQQMYLSSQDRPRHMQSSSPMLIPGIPPTRSFEASYSAGDGQPGVQVLGPTPFMLGTGMSSGITQPGLHRSSTPPVSPGKMNPQAATFDPSFNYGNQPEK